MLRLPLFLLATSAAAIPSSYLRPLERDLRDMETAIEALNAKAASKGLRLEKTSEVKKKVVKVVHPAPDEEEPKGPASFFVELEGASDDSFTVDALKAKIVTIMKPSSAYFYCKQNADESYDKDKLSIGDEDRNFLSPSVTLDDGQTVYLLKNCMVNHGSGEEEQIPKRKWKALQGKTF